MLATGGSALVQLNRAVRDFCRKNDHEKKLEDHAEKAKEQGASRWSTWEDIEHNDNFSETEGLFIGQMLDKRGRRRDVRLKASARRNILVNAPAGAGKTTCVTLPGILSLSDSRGKTECFSCFDPTAELLAITFPWLKKHGYEIVVQTPFIDEVREITGIKDLQDVGFDAFSAISLGMPERKLRSELRSIAKRVIPDIPGMDEETKFFYAMARKLFIYGCLRDLGNGVKPTLPGLAKQLLRGPSYLSEMFAEDEDNDAFEGMISELSAAYGGTLRSGAEMFASGYEVLEQHLQDFDHRGSLGEHVSRSLFDPRRLKDPKEKIAHFLIYPLEHLESHAPQISMSITHMADALAADRRPGRCTIFIEEAGAVPLLSLAKNLNLYRKTGQRYVLIFQDTLGQTEANYGKAIRHQIIAGTQIQIALSGIIEYESLKMFSDLAGRQGLVTSNLTDRAYMGEVMPDLSPGMGVVTVPLAGTDDVRLLGPGKMLMIAEHLPAAKLEMLRYFEREEWRRGTASNPYHFEDDDE